MCLTLLPKAKLNQRCHIVKQGYSNYQMILETQTNDILLSYQKNMSVCPSRGHGQRTYFERLSCFVRNVAHKNRDI